MEGRRKKKVKEGQEKAREVKSERKISIIIIKNRMKRRKRRQNRKKEEQKKREKRGKKREEERGRETKRRSRGQGNSPTTPGRLCSQCQDSAAALIRPKIGRRFEKKRAMAIHAAKASREHAK